MLKTLAFAMLLLVMTVPVSAGFKEGWTAYERGDYWAAFREFKPLAEQGHANAQSYLGFMYYAHGQGVPNNYAEAVKWWRKAALQGNPIAQYNLGLMYGAGLGVSKDYDEAFRWYRRAALQGDAKAQYELGVMWANGHGVPKDYGVAIWWYRKAAQHGNAKAQYNLGALYGAGLGINKDVRMAFKWYSLAVANQNSRASKALDRLITKMSAAEIARAKKLLKAAQTKRPGKATAETLPAE